MVTVVIAAGWVKNLTAGSFFPYIFQTTNGQIVNSWTVAAPMDPHLGTMISNGKISCMNFRSKCFSSIWMKSPSSSTQRWRRDLTSAKIWQIPSLGPKRAPTCFELVVVLFPDLSAPQIQAWYLCRDLHIPEIVLYFKSERCYKLPFSYSVSSGFFQSNIWYSELVLKAGDLSAVISRVFHEQAKNFRLSNQQ